MIAIGSSRTHGKPDGVVVGRWQLVERLGAGGTSEVWLARAVDGGREAVVKRVRPRHASAPAFATQLAYEGRLLAELHHPNVVALVETGDDHLVLERLDGHSLAALLDAAEPDAPPPPDVGCAIVAAVCRALGAAHRLGIVHRDVSPSNVVVTHDGDVKLIDFGVATRADDAERPRTATGVVKGKRAYLAPEQRRGGPASPASDLYAAGVLLWEVLTARRRDPESAVAPGVNPRIDAICVRALAEAPAARFASADEMAAALEACAARVGAAEIGALVTARLGGDRTSATRVEVRRRRRPRERSRARLALAGALVGLLLVGAAVGAWRLLRRPAATASIDATPKVATPAPLTPPAAPPPIAAAAESPVEAPAPRPPRRPKRSAPPPTPSQRPRTDSTPSRASDRYFPPEMKHDPFQ